MHKQFFFWIVVIALICLLIIFLSFWWQVESPVSQKAQTQPTETPYFSSISGVGIVEPSSENILIGTPITRIVDNVKVTVGEKVKKGDILFTLENKDLQADLKVKTAAFESSLAKLEKLESYPRPEDLAAANAASERAKAALASARNLFEMTLDLPDPRAISQQEKNQRLYSYQQAEAQWQKAQADLDKIKKGTWKPDIEIAQKEVEEAKAQVDQVKTELERGVIRSPIDGTVLQINIHKGELAASDSQNPLMIVGNVDELYLKVGINQLDIPLFKPNAKAVAFLQGDGKEKFPLEFVRIDPFLTPKKNLTNSITETVDTRVLHIIYKIKNNDHKLYVGQQMDVFIDTKEPLRK